MYRISFVLAMCLTAGVAAADFDGSDPSCCPRCGCHSACRKVCRLVCETKKVPQVTYCCKCEDFCVPGPSQRCGTTCECDCNGHVHRKPNYVPTCASVHTKKVLVKHVEQKEVPSYKWVVEYVCDQCGCCTPCSVTEVAPGEMPQVPPAPTPDAQPSVRKASFLESLFGRSEK